MIRCMNMNKYMGFYELKYLDIPTVPWQKFDPSVILDDKHLWTIRVAVESGNDFNLPRAVGVKPDQAYNKGLEYLRKYGDRGIVIYYPFFIADKSGVVDISQERTVIEGVNGDLWNLVSNGLKDETVVIRDGSFTFEGNEGFLTKQELDEILGHASALKRRYRDFISEGKSLLLEWSYAFNSDIDKNTIGQRYLVFYELRTVG